MGNVVTPGAAGRMSALPQGGGQAQGMLGQQAISAQHPGPQMTAGVQGPQQLQPAAGKSGQAPMPIAGAKGGGFGPKAPKMAGGGYGAGK